MLKLADKQSCTGCTACSSICRFNCIQMIEDEHGFYFPQVDISKCVNCGMCESVCPVLNEQKKHTAATEVYAAYSTDSENREVSSSGGLFTEFARYIFRENGAVYGAAYDDSFRVYHICAENEEQLSRLRGAKYSQSNINGVFSEIKQRLNNGQQVLFSGTPCQTAGLISFLGKEYSNLTTVDFICHGIPSPMAWEKYIEFRTEKDNDSLPPVSINQRSKKTGWSRYGYSIEFKYEHNEYLNSNADDLFMKLFIGDYLSRECCSDCHFKGFERCSDITIGDFWGVWELIPEMDDNCGTSVVLTHSDKGKALLESVSVDLISKKVPLDYAGKYNPSLLHSSPAKQERGEVLNEILNGNIEKCTELFATKTSPSKMQKLKTYLRRLAGRR